MSFDARTAVDSIGEAFPDAIIEVSEFRGETTLLITKESLESVAKHLKEKLGFKFLVDVTAVDYLGIKSPRFEVVYLLHRFGDDYDDNIRLRLKVGLPEDEPRVKSLTGVWSGANWLERETQDMFGIEFEGHPDPRRILMPEDYEYYPLRKDFDVRNREPSKRCFERELEKIGADFKGSK